MNDRYYFRDLEEEKMGNSKNVVVYVGIGKVFSPCQADHTIVSCHSVGVAVISCRPFVGASTAASLSHRR